MASPSRACAASSMPGAFRHCRVSMSPGTAVKLLRSDHPFLADFLLGLCMDDAHPDITFSPGLSTQRDRSVGCMRLATQDSRRVTATLPTQHTFNVLSPRPVLQGQQGRCIATCPMHIRGTRLANTISVGSGRSVGGSSATTAQQQTAPAACHAVSAVRSGPTAPCSQ